MTSLVVLSYAGTDFDRSQYAKSKKSGTRRFMRKLMHSLHTKMMNPLSSPSKTPSEQGSPTEESKSSIEDTAPKIDVDDRSNLKSEHNSNRDKGEDSEESSGFNKNLDINQGLGAGWTFPLFENSAAKVVNTLNCTVERTVDESNMSRFIPSALKNRLFQGDEPSTPVGQKFKRVAMTTARKSVNSIKKLRESFFSSEEVIQFGATKVFSENETKPLEDTLSKEYYFREQRTRILVASIIEDTTNLVQDAFTEVGATKAMVDTEFKRRLLEEFIQHNLISWDSIRMQIDDEKNKDRLRAMVWDHVCAQFPNHSRPFSPI
jgi:hypothetical protein